MTSPTYLLSGLPVPLPQEGMPLASQLATLLGGKPDDYQHCQLVRQSLDARHKAQLRWLLSIVFDTSRALDLEKFNETLQPGMRLSVAPPPPDFTIQLISHRPTVVIVGTGPAGSFCALRLLDYGITPILVERGPRMEERIPAVERLWQKGLLDVHANAQFGEGGAGTFSDGKLATRVDHPYMRYVLEAFVRFGASPHILISSKPHVGTDEIRHCSVALRQEAEKRGARYLFKRCLSDIVWHQSHVQAACLDNGDVLACDALVLAIGHSARDTFEMLLRHQVAMAQKPFAMGVRIEHPQALINQSQYGPWAEHPTLGAADYKLTCNLSEDRAAYSFCMCPGGEIIQCASEIGGVVVNGMSQAARNSGFANAGLVAKVNTHDFGSPHPLAGVALQRHWERVCFQAAGKSYGAPAMSVQAFLKGKVSGHLPRSTFRPFLKAADLRQCLPSFVVDQLALALPVFEKKIKGFTSQDALLVAIESRTSSPVQLRRGPDCQSLSHPGLYPCGEGAGYAGGITSAAMDGMRVADAIARQTDVSPSPP